MDQTRQKLLDLCKECYERPFVRGKVCGRCWIKGYNKATKDSKD